MLGSADHVEALGQLLLVLDPDDLEEVDVSVERRVVVVSQLLEDWHDAKHEQLEAQVQPELQLFLQVSER